MGNSKIGKITRSMRFVIISRLTGMVFFFGVAATVVFFLSLKDKLMRVFDSELVVAVRSEQKKALPDAERDERFGEIWGRSIYPVLIRDLPLKHDEPSELNGLPDDLPDGLQTFRHNGTDWRAFIFTDRQGARHIAAYALELRSAKTAEWALAAGAPYIALLIFMTGGIIYGIGVSFRPLQKMAHTLDVRDENDLSPLDASTVPAEIRPFINAVNGLLEKVSDHVEMQKRFVANAAHELRSPPDRPIPPSRKSELFGTDGRSRREACRFAERHKQGECPYISNAGACQGFLPV